jgi:hypothetical protein
MKVTTLRDGQGRILGTTTSFSNSDSVARDRNGRILGRSSETFNNTRDRDGHLISDNIADSRLLFCK